MNRSRVGEELTRNAINLCQGAAVPSLNSARTESLQVCCSVPWAMLGRSEVDTLTLYYAAARVGAAASSSAVPV
jgi:hypothetical protein